VEVELRSAVATLRDLGYSYWLACAQADLARWLERQLRHDQAADRGVVKKHFRRRPEPPAQGIG
jgi:hypothetical protein